MLCRRTSSGVLSTLLPAVSTHLQAGFPSFTEQTERGSPDLFQHQQHAYVSTPRSSLQSPASQHLKPAADVTRSTDGGDWYFEGATNSVGFGMPDRFRKVQSEKDLQLMWRTSSGSAATFAAAGSFSSAASQDDRDQLAALDMLALERESAIQEMSEKSDDITPAGSEASEEPREMLPMVNQGRVWSDEATMGENQHSDQYGNATRGASKVVAEPSQNSGPRRTNVVVRSRSMSTVEARRGNVLERSGHTPSSQNEMRGPMLITDTGFGSGSGGSGRGGVSGGSGGGGYEDSNGVEAQYRRMLHADPGHPLLLRNYARFLHEVKHDPHKAEAYYERAILASPGDGELLGQYAQLIWEVYKDEDRAGGYFDQALQACPNDCYLNAAYAAFLWSSEGDEDEDAESPQEVSHASGSGYINMPPMYGTATVSA